MPCSPTATAVLKLCIVERLTVLASESFSMQSAISTGVGLLGSIFLGAQYDIHFFWVLGAHPWRMRSAALYENFLFWSPVLKKCRTHHRLNGMCFVEIPW